MERAQQEKRELPTNNGNVFNKKACSRTLIMNPLLRVLSVSSLERKTAEIEMHHHHKYGSFLLSPRCLGTINSL